MDIKKYGPWALIVGGSEGIGAAFAHKLAAQGFKIVLVARKPEPLADLAQALRSSHEAEVRTLSVDLSTPEALDKVRGVTDDLEVGLLIYNAGANSVRGAFVDLEPQVYRSVLAVNILGPAEFAHHFGALMRDRRRGGIITTGSLSGYIGTPTLATYCGAKAFSRVFTEALWCECAAFGVDVLHLNVPYTATPAMARLGYDLNTAYTPEHVAQDGLDNIANGPVKISGGPADVTRAEEHSQIAGRDALVRAVTPPPRK